MGKETSETPKDLTMGETHWLINILEQMKVS